MKKVHIEEAKCHFQKEIQLRTENCLLLESQNKKINLELSQNLCKTLKGGEKRETEHKRWGGPQQKEMNDLKRRASAKEGNAQGY